MRISDWIPDREDYANTVVFVVVALFFWVTAIVWLPIAMLWAVWELIFTKDPEE